MNIKRIISIGLSLVILCLAVPGSSCKSRTAACRVDGPYKTKKMKKNKSSYGSKYSYKVKPVRKAYVIRNSRK
ncbi:MAG: hypothetical protein NT040_19160 [Bacteroidetes bacterium]|nr:hypothetical protein [Bacteroidota bacterium]